MALLISLTASLTSLSSTVGLSRIFACASESRIIDSSCLVVAVIRRSADWIELPSERMATYADVRALAAGWVICGWMLLLAYEM